MSFISDYQSLRVFISKSMCRPPEPIQMPEVEKSEYELIRLENIEEREREYLRIFGAPINLDHLKY